MPQTVNGIGTHYHGKKNIQKRPGTCRSCGRNVELTSYDTRLWFVILFIPIIPLGRKRILDDCPSCRRHYVMDLDKWEAARQLEVSGAMEKFRSNPTPEDAMAAHQQLINFHQLPEAAEFRKVMREKYPDNARVHVYLGEALTHLGLFSEADEAFARALELRADMPEARVGVAHGHIRAQRLDAARALMDFLEKPGAGQLYPLDPVETLALAYQKVGNHQAALELFKILQVELPKIVEHKGFRTNVKKSEKALKRQESQLPKQPFSFKRLFSVNVGAGAGSPQLTWRSLLGLGIVVALVMLGFIISNEYIRRHRTLHVVNGFSQPATVRLSNGAEIKGLRGLQSLPLGEGRYHASISGPVTAEMDFEVRSSYFDRWFGDPAWLINVGGAATLIERAVIYSRDPRSPVITFHYGKPFEYFDRVTHPFGDLPQSLRMKSHEERTLVDLQLYSGTGSDLVQHFLGQNRFDDALNFSENWLGVHPEDEQVLRVYGATAVRQGRSQRAEEFYKRQLATRPVRIEWHRAYQELHDTVAGHPQLVAEYDQLLRAEPGDSALLYLRGRLADDRASARDYFGRAEQADPQNPYPVYALGYDHMIAGDWAAARARLARAVELRPDDRSFKYLLQLTRLGAGESREIETEMRDQVGRNPADIPANIQLINVLAARDLTGEALKVCTDFGLAARSTYGNEAVEITAELRAHALYATGNFAELEKLAGLSGVAARRYRAEAMIEQGHVAEGAKLLAAQKDSPDALVDALALAVAFRQAGDNVEAGNWQRQAHQLLAGGSSDSLRAATLLDAPVAPTLVQARELVLSIKAKAVLLAALVQLHPEARAELAPLARSLNVDRTFPFHLVQHVTAQSL